LAVALTAVAVVRGVSARTEEAEAARTR